jgi:N-carbamoylputrescine amidase
MQERVRVAAVAVDTKPGQLEYNFTKIEDWCRQAAEQGADLISFQELSLSGFLPNHPTENHEKWLRSALHHGRIMAQTIPGPVTERLQQIAVRYGVLIAVGVLEDAGNLMFNTQILVDSTGLVGRFRKMHVPMFEMPFYNGGESATVVETRLGRIGVNICFDALIPESTRLLAVQNVEIVLFPFAADPPPGDVAGWENWARVSLSARCIENGVYGVASNYVGTVEAAGTTQRFPGGGMIVGPRGEQLAAWKTPTGEAGMLIHDLMRDDLLAARSEPEYLFRFRRPELYRSIAQ